MSTYPECPKCHARQWDDAALAEHLTTCDGLQGWER